MDMSTEVMNVRNTLRKMLAAEGIDEATAKEVIREMAIKQIDAIIVEMQAAKQELMADRVQA